LEYQLAGLQIIDFSGQPYKVAFEQLVSALSDIDLSHLQETKPEEPTLSILAKRILSLPFLTGKPLSKRQMRFRIAGLLLVGIGILFYLFLQFLVSGKDLSGNYKIRGHDFDCVEYAGKVEISESGSIYLVEGETWWMDGRLRSKGGGVGTLDGDIFTINWGVDQGKTSYRVQSDGSLSVMWVDYATSCIPGEEFTPK
jgi:hypothetical protein